MLLSNFSYDFMSSSVRIMLSIVAETTLSRFMISFSESSAISSTNSAYRCSTSVRAVLRVSAFYRAWFQRAANDALSEYFAISSCSLALMTLNSSSCLPSPLFMFSISTSSSSIFYLLSFVRVWICSVSFCRDFSSSYKISSSWTSISLSAFSLLV